MEDLWELVEPDKKSVIKFLEAHGLKVLGNKIEMHFSDGEVDESTIDQQSFVNLLELQFEPSLVKVEIVIEDFMQLNSNITVILESLLSKIHQL